MAYTREQAHELLQIIEDSYVRTKQIKAYEKTVKSVEAILREKIDALRDPENPAKFVDNVKAKKYSDVYNRPVI